MSNAAVLLPPTDSTAKVVPGVEGWSDGPAPVDPPAARTDPASPKTGRCAERTGGGPSGSAIDQIPTPRARRLWLASLGVACVALGGVGAVVPGLPTTVFLIIASWCFTRSCPWLERRLLGNRFFAPFMRYAHPGAVMPLRARVVSTVLLLGAVVPSVVLLVNHDMPTAVPALVALAGVGGMVCIWRVARGRRAPAA